MSFQRVVILLVLSGLAGGARSNQGSERLDIRRGADTEAAALYRFPDSEAALLDEIQRACFLYFWREVGTPAMLVRDRLKAPVSSVAAVGFQLSSLPIGVERGWITRDEGMERAVRVLTSLLTRTDNRRDGIYLHFPDHNSGGASRAGYETVASTVDTALLIAGAIPAGEYFGGPVMPLVERLVGDANWKAFAVGPNGFISMGWRPTTPRGVAGDGEFLSPHWYLASDEERLVYLLACGAPNGDHAVTPRKYYELKRVIKSHGKMAPFVVTWPGALFTHVFSHCWIDYRTLGLDDPSRLGVTAPRVDWFENSRRAVLTHRARCLESAGRFKTFGSDRWGLSACAGRDGYIVPQMQPNLSGKDEWFEGTIAPYAAGSAIMFAPAESVAALRGFRSLKDAEGHALVWRDPSTGGYGFADAFNLDQGFVSDDYVGIDQGPMLLAIENARTGLIWRLFMRNAMVCDAVARLRLDR